MNEKIRHALKLVGVEFAVVFAAEVGWNRIAETGQSLFDSFVIAFMTAIALFVFHSKDKSRRRIS